MSVLWQAVQCRAPPVSTRAACTSSLGRLATNQTLTRRSHLKPRRPGQPPVCQIRFTCPAEQCGKHYADKPGLARHARECRYLTGGAGGPGKYRCVCDKPFARWDKFTAHHGRVCAKVRQPGPGRYTCQCSASFDNFASFLEHHKSEYKKVGRPKKSKVA